MTSGPSASRPGATISRPPCCRASTPNRSGCFRPGRLAATLRVHGELTASVRHAAISFRRYRPEALLALREDRPQCEVLFISDLHITAAAVRTLESRLDCERGLAFVERLVQQTRPRLVVVCGDVTDTGHPEAVQRSRRFFEGLGVPVVGTIGNHDVQFERMNMRHGSPLPYLRGLLSRSLNDPQTLPPGGQAADRAQAFRSGRGASAGYPALHADPDAPMIASCGSVLFPAMGPNAAIGTASAFGTRLGPGGGIEILTYAAEYA